MMKKRNKFEIPWWDEWYNADLLKRLEMVKKLGLIRESIDLAKIPDKKIKPKMKIDVLASCLNGLFEDLAGYMRERNRLKLK